MEEKNDGGQAAAEKEPSRAALALVAQFRESISTAQWDLGLHAFCALVGFNPEHDHGREKFRDFVSLTSYLNKFSEATLARIIDWHRERAQAAAAAACDHTVGTAATPDGRGERVVRQSGAAGVELLDSFDICPRCGSRLKAEG